MTVVGSKPVRQPGGSVAGQPPRTEQPHPGDGTRGLGLLSILLSVSIYSSPAQSAETWAQWRGATRDGQFQGDPWPDSLDENHLSRLWRVPLGPSYSGPIVGRETVFTTESVDERTEVVRALDRDTGEERWRQEWVGGMDVPFFAKANGDWIRATPALDGDRLYVAGMRDVLVCLSARSGQEVWRMDFVESLETPLPEFGYVSSPLVAGGAVYTQAGASVVKLDKMTGEVLWRALPDEGGMWGSAFSSPILATLNGKLQLVVQTRTDLAGLDPGTGEVLWFQPVEAFRGMNILTPVVFQDSLLTSTYRGQTILHGLQQVEGEYRLEPLWQQKFQGYMSTPVIIDGHAYLHLRNQRLLCLDLASGEEKWMHHGGFGKYWSLVANGTRLLGLDQEGRLYLVEADPAQYRQLDDRTVSENETWAHLAVTDGFLYIRELDALSAWRWREP